MFSPKVFLVWTAASGLGGTLGLLAAQSLFPDAPDGGEKFGFTLILSISFALAQWFALRLLFESRFPDGFRDWLWPASTMLALSMMLLPLWSMDYFNALLFSLFWFPLFAAVLGLFQRSLLENIVPNLKKWVAKSSGGIFVGCLVGLNAAPALSDLWEGPLAAWGPSYGASSAMTVAFGACVFLGLGAGQGWALAVCSNGEEKPRN